MEYPHIPPNLKQAPYQELARAEMDLRHYKNVTILGIPHWRAIPQLKESAKKVSADQRRVMKEIKARPEFLFRSANPQVIMPSAESRKLIHAHMVAKFAERERARQQKLEIGDRVHSTYHDADGKVARIEYSARVGSIYHVKLDNGETVYCAREDLSKLEK